MTAQRITKKTLQAAEKLAGLIFTDDEHKLMLDGVREILADYEKIRAIPIENSVPPALSFDPRLPGMTFEGGKRSFILSDTPLPPVPQDLEKLAFWPAIHLAHLLRGRQITSTALTQMYLTRLKRYDPALHCVVTLMEERALEQAHRADEEIAAGRYRGPLHGLPYGVKDLLSARGLPTAWGAPPYKDQVFEHNATVVQRLEDAGAVLLAKLSVGSLAWDDIWFGGQTKNPWNIAEGSSGSSAGSAAATVAGLVSFSIGTETLGSIVSPCTRCRVTGLRPTFGRVSRYGAMALSWSMDKIGPICRTVEDCALIFNAIYGPDGKDGTVVDLPFHWDSDATIAGLRIGYVQDAFEEDHEGKALDLQALDTLRSLGAELIPVKLPDYPVEAILFILVAEAAAAFDELTRSNRDDLLVRQAKDSWPNTFRKARLIPAVEYIQANRVRTLLMREMAKVMADVDLYVTPSFAGKTLLMTNLTGHPAVVVPDGVDEDGHPSSLTFTGRLYGESQALLAARAYQEASGFHLKHPTLDFKETEPTK